MARPKHKSKSQLATEAAYGNASHLLIAALEVTALDLHPPRPFHGGGPQPKIDAAAYVTAVLWIADRAEPFVDEADRPAFDRIVGLTRKQVMLGRTDPSLRQQLLTASRERSTRVPLKIAQWTAHEAHNWTARSIYAGGAARPAARQLAKLLLETQSPSHTQAYLVELDALCVHLEAMVMLANHELVPGAAPLKTLWRGSIGDKATHWIMRLADGQLALISKIGARWKLTEGRRDFVLAHVADQLLDGAAAATD
jgi:hypothetical protein